MGAYPVFALDPRPASKEAMIQLLKEKAPVVGIEVTIPAFLERLERNIDGQHSTEAANIAACELALDETLPKEETTLALVRPDADALLACAVLNLRKDGNTITEEMRNRVAFVAKHDTFARGPWPGVRPIDLDLDPDGEVALFKGVGALAMSHALPLSERVARFEAWLTTGVCEGLEQARNTALATLQKAIQESKIVVNGKVAIIESRHIGATDVGYYSAPTLVIRNDAFRFPGVPGEHVKYTICSYEAGMIDFKALTAQLNTIEKNGTWGGSATIIGSPQGVSSSLTLDEVAEQATSALL